jgi:hypothetical protein
MAMSEPAPLSGGGLPSIDRLAVYLGARFKAEHIISIGRASKRPDPELQPIISQTLAVATALEHGAIFSSPDRWINIDAETAGALPPHEVLNSAVVICELLADKQADHDHVLAAAACASAIALAVILTAPVCHEDSERDLRQLRDRLARRGLRPTFLGVTGRSSNDRVVAIMDHCPVEVGRAAPDTFRPLALMATYNDADIAKYTICRLLKDGIDVHVRDNWSTDGTFEQLISIASEHDGLTVRRFPAERPGRHHDLLGMLKWKEEVASEHPGRWIVTQDSDEIRCSPWRDISFRGGIYVADQMGFDAIDFTVLDFRPVDDRFVAGMDPEPTLDHFELGCRPGLFRQIKAWRQANNFLNLTDSGGHDAKLAGRRIFPYKFMLKHYPLRNSQQARQKVFVDRLPRYAPETRARGWHIQYDHWKPDDTFLWDPANLTQFEQSTTRQQFLLELISGIGIAERAVS